MGRRTWKQVAPGSDCTRDEAAMAANDALRGVETKSEPEPGALVVKKGSKMRSCRSCGDAAAVVPDFDEEHVAGEL